MSDADRVPVDLRPAPQAAPWEARRPKQTQGWDRKPWQPEPGGATVAAGVRKRLRRTRESEEVGFAAAVSAPAAPSASELASVRAAAREREAELLRDCLHEWRAVSAFARGRSVPARRVRSAPGGVWAALAGGVAAARVYRPHLAPPRPRAPSEPEAEEGEDFEPPPAFELLASTARAARVLMLQAPARCLLLLLLAAAATALLAAAAGPRLRLGPAGALVSAPPLLLAAAAHDADALQRLLREGGAASARLRLLGGALGSATPLWAAVAADGPPPTPLLLSRLLEAGAGARAGAGLGPGWLLAAETPLGAAARRGSALLVPPLLQAGASAREGLRLGPAGLLGTASPLAAACWHGHAAAAQALLEAGAPPAAGASLGMAGAWGGASPLFLALAGGAAAGQRAALADALLARAPTAARAGLLLGPGGALAAVTPLGAAALRDDGAAVARLLAAGAEPRRCVRLLALWLRCARVGGPQTKAALRRAGPPGQWPPQTEPPPELPLAQRAEALLLRLQASPSVIDELELAALEAELALELGAG